jgi:catechol-2,3-dioxygenase
VARFYEHFLGFEATSTYLVAQLWDPTGGVHPKFQGEDWHEPLTWPGSQAKMLHFEVEVDPEAAVRTAIGGGGAEAPWQPPDRRRDGIRIVLTPGSHSLCLFLRGE